MHHGICTYNDNGGKMPSLTSPGIGMVLCLMLLVFIGFRAPFRFLRSKPPLRAKRTDYASPRAISVRNFSNSIDMA